MNILESLRSLVRRRDRNEPPPQAFTPRPVPKKMPKVRTDWSVTWDPERGGWSPIGSPIRKAEAQKNLERQPALRKRAAAA